MSSLEATIERTDLGISRVSLSGTMDENSDFEAVFRELDGDVCFDLEQVTRINSIGIHGWIKKIKPFTSDGRTVVIEACSYPVMLQANIVANFFGSARIDSCMAPYFCPGCNEDRNVLVTAGDVAAAGAAPPSMSCTSCNAAMEFDELDSYLDLLRAVS